MIESDALAAVQNAVADAFIKAQVDIQKLQTRIEGIDTNLKRLKEGRSPIDDGTRALMQALKAAGIDAEPICDVVEVTDEKWKVAAELALGRSREALIVDPAGRCAPSTSTAPEQMRRIGARKW